MGDVVFRVGMTGVMWGVGGVEGLGGHDGRLGETQEACSRTQKQPYLDEDGLPEAPHRCIRILSWQRIFFQSLDILGPNHKIASYIGSEPQSD